MKISDVNNINYCATQKAQHHSFRKLMGEDAFKRQCEKEKDSLPMNASQTIESLISGYLKPHLNNSKYDNQIASFSLAKNGEKLSVNLDITDYSECPPRQFTRNLDKDLVEISDKSSYKNTKLLANDIISWHEFNFSKPVNNIEAFDSKLSDSVHKKNNQVEIHREIPGSNNSDFNFDDYYNRVLAQESFL